MIPELEIIEMLCRGVDPRNGELLHTPHAVNVDKARLNLLSELKKLDKRIKGQSSKPPKDPDHPNKGKLWSKGDDRVLMAKWDNGLTLDAMAPEFGRTPGALCARLASLSVGAQDQKSIMLQNLQRGGEYGKIALENAGIKLE